MAIKPQFFLIRPGAEQITPNGRVISQPATAVPLIPADLLPEWLEVIGAPRSLSPDETKDMRNVGVIHAELGTYKLRFSPITKDDSSESDEPDTSNGRAFDIHSSLVALDPSSSEQSYEKPKPPAIQLSTPKVRLRSSRGLSSSCHNPANQQQSDQLDTRPHNEIPRIPTNTTAPSSSLPSPCRYWCNHGICKWDLDCRYEHTMPTTAAGLAEVGLNRFPDWWLQARGLMPMPRKALCATEAPSGRRTARKIAMLLKRKQRARSQAQRVQSRNLEEEAEAEEGYEEEVELEEEQVKAGLKRGAEGILIDLD
ncbi:transcription factor [Fusarium beomiforme]|uniref:Transcription factor n=1 Tax=Fusarium beomiforme TaxID=44412 RepID=A0A9P5AVJ6_9HYPO|nr:transcription factor [Fusarium beomiforme]